jgi:hypothetical protein
MNTHSVSASILVAVGLILKGEEEYRLRIWR